MTITQLPKNNVGERIVYNARTFKRVVANNFGHFKLQIFCKDGNVSVITTSIEKGGQEKFWISPYCVKIIAEHVETKEKIIFNNLVEKP